MVPILINKDVFEPSCRQRGEKNGNSDRLFFGAPKSLQMVTAAKKLKDTWPFEECYDKPRQHIKKKRYHFADKRSI